MLYIVISACSGVLTNLAVIEGVTLGKKVIRENCWMPVAANTHSHNTDLDTHHQS